MSGNIVYPWRESDETWWMDVDCLHITGNTAQISGVVTKAAGDVSPGIFVGQRYAWKVQDNGAGAASLPDRVSWIYFDTNVSCNPAPGPFPFNWAVDGNFQIRD